MCSLGICVMVLSDINLQQLVVYNMLSSNPVREVKLVALHKCIFVINCKYMNIPIKARVLTIIHIYTVAQ